MNLNCMVRLRVYTLGLKRNKMVSYGNLWVSGMISDAKVASLLELELLILNPKPEPETLNPKTQTKT